MKINSRDEKSYTKMGTNRQTRLTLLEKLQHEEASDCVWDDFVKYYERYIYFIIHKYGFTHKDCEDLVQEVLVKVWKALPKYSYNKKKSRFRTWLYIVIRNTIYNHSSLRQNRDNAKNVSFDSVITSLDLKYDSEISKIVEDEWRIYIANMAWNNLKDDFSEINRKIFEASLQNEDNSALAEKYGMAESSIRVCKMRIKKAIHKEIVRLNRELEG